MAGMPSTWGNVTKHAASFFSIDSSGGFFCKGSIIRQERRERLRIQVIFSNFFFFLTDDDDERGVGQPIMIKKT